MLTAILLALSPFVLNLVMAVVKWLSPMESTSSKRVVLALFSLAGVIAVSATTGSPVDPNVVSSILQTLVETFVAFLLAHGSYTLFWKRRKAANIGE
jgi:hypothetical protein